MQQPIPPEILSRLDALAAKLNVTAQYLWGVLVRQARIEAVGDIALMLFLSGLTYGAYRIFKFMAAKIKAENFPDEWMFFTQGFLIFSMSVLTIVNIHTAIDILTPLLNPEYWALQQILNVCK